MTSQREIKTCFRLPFTVGSQLDFFVIAVAKIKMIYVKRKRRGCGGREEESQRENMNLSV